MKRCILSLILCLISCFLFAQNCDCKSHFEWLKKTFEENDAGFQYIIDQKGKTAYELHNQLIYRRLNEGTDPSKCTEIFEEWLRFFRKGHIGIQWKSWADWVLPEDTITFDKNNREVYNIDIEEFKIYLAAKDTLDFEGIYSDENYTIGIKKENDDYIGFIIGSKYEEWKAGDVKLKISGDENYKKALYYMKNKSEISTDVLLIGEKYLAVYALFTREFPIPKEDKNADNYLKLLLSAAPYFEKLDKNTAYLHIPSFDIKYKKLIDSVINVNKKQISNSKNLIIDLRSNGGGADGSFKNLLPIIYTNPVRTPGVEFFSTPNNNKMFLEIANDTIAFNKETRQWADSVYHILEQHPNQFVDINPEKISIDSYDKIEKYPQNVGIIINEACGSTTEQFLLAAKQSKKVKLFGHTTAGCLDISNMTSIESPNGEFALWYCISKSHRIPNMTIDDSGIQPDFYIDEEISDWDWVDFTKNILEK